MNKEEQVMMGFWNAFNKIIWLNSIKLKVSLNGYNPSEIHCIEYIGRNIDYNVIKLADSLYMTRSAISKLTKKLMKKGLIESYQKPDNRKEIYFRLTEKGVAINKIHEELHKEYQERDKPVFEQVTKEQFEVMISFAEKYNRHLDTEIEKLGVDLKSGYFDKL
ncbi:MarR family transcriptional regulator [Metaclostridioides mangenotii]|uniref:MarR family transcriptional regulator n=1 Tax=Metaclostridioides mangenotii TaxID=1540 RepID=UPI00046325E0|nr:MarR family transcriptional regulator [Clostridioides mangenotii]